jgi:hypothetical protein
MSFVNPFGKKGSSDSKPSRLEKDVDYCVDGGVVFRLGEGDFTFEKFYVHINDEGLFLKIAGEVPMNLINILETVHDNVDVNRKMVLDSNKVDFILQLDPDLFREFEPRIIKCEDPRDIFELDLKGFTFLKELEHYYLIEYGTMTRRLKFHLGGKLGNAIRRKVGF